MTAVWQDRLSAAANRVDHGLVGAFSYLSRPTAFARLKFLLLCLLSLWLMGSLWRGAWSFLPEAAPIAEVTVINPTMQGPSAATETAVDIERLVAANLFGTPGSSIAPEELAEASGRSPAMSEAEAAVALAGIEDGAPETRLPLLLRGVVASSEAGLGQAVIEYQKRQDLYQVGDEIPVNAEVTLAKVLPELVVLDNGGRFEVLRLFEDTPLSRQVEGVARQVEPATMRQPAARATEPEARSVEAGQDAGAVAARYRDQLYQNPESLAEVVRITAVREGDQMRGYRISPGRASAEFAALGFEPGDIVTGVNGLSLTDPANTVRLYQAMRSAQAASFELERKGETVTLEVSIGGGGGE